MSTLQVVVFGGSGFIGTRLVKCLLEAGCRVCIADIRPSTAYPDLYVKADVCNREEVLRVCKGMDVIYNLAAEHDDDVSPIQRYYDVNVGGAQNTCQAAEQLGIQRIIFVSSVAVYGLPDRETDENGALAPFNHYGKSKLQAEEVHRQWAGRAEGRCLVIVRPTVIFGAGNRRNFFVLMTQIHAGRFLMVGDGRNKKSVGYVDNCAAFLAFVLRYTTGVHVFNYVDKPDFDMNTLVPLLRSMLGMSPKIGFRLPYWAGYALGTVCDALAWITGRNLPFSAVRVKKFCGSTEFSAQKALDAGFVPPVTIREGLERTIQAEFFRTEAEMGPGQSTPTGQPVMGRDPEVPGTA